MTTRRRFFPGKPVQTAPGQTVDIEVQLTPEGEAAPAPEPVKPSCSVDRVIWVPIAAEADDALWMPDFNGTSLQHLDFRPADIAWGEDNFYDYYGLPEGDAVCGVIWQWSWSNNIFQTGEPWSTYYEMAQRGPYLYVRLKPVPYYGGEHWQTTLTATALCGDNIVGTLNMTLEIIPY